MKILNVLCGENVIRDADAGKFIIYNLIDDVTSIGFPFLFSTLAIYFFAEKENEDSTNEFEADLLIKNNEVEIFKNKIKMSFNEHSKNRGIIKFNGLVISQAGELSITLSTSTNNSKTLVIPLSLASKPPQVK